MSDKYLFWLDDPSILYKKYTEIIPTNNMSRVEQLNAMTRLFIYLLLILLLFNCLDGWIYIPIIGIIFIVILYNIYKYDPYGRMKENLNKRTSIDENFQMNYISDLNDKVNYEVQSGYYDADGNLRVGKEYTVYNNNDKDLIYTTDEILDYNTATCKHPTEDNPFMNPTVTDFNLSDPPVACNSDDDEIKEEIEENFNKGLYMDLNDLFNVKNSQRMWYTVPMPAIPPDQTSFAKWLFKSEVTCKENDELCLRWDDVRYDR